MPASPVLTLSLTGAREPGKWHSPVEEEHPRSWQGGFPSVDAEIVVDLPAADALMVALPLLAFFLQVIRRIVGAEGRCDHLVPFQVVEGLAERGRQKANAALPQFGLRHLIEVVVVPPARIQMALNPIQPG